MIVKREILVFLFLCFSIFSLNRAFAADYYVDFLKGDIKQKTEAVKKSAENKKGGIALQALEFCCESYQYLQKDKDLETLASESVKILPTSENFSNVLANVFNTFESDFVRTAIVDNVSKYSEKVLSETSSKPIVSSVTQFLINSAKKNDKATILHGKMIVLLGKVSAESTFDTLFELYDKNVWKEYGSLLETSLVNMSAVYRDKVKEFITNGSPRQKLLAFRIASGHYDESSYISELAMDALTESIYSVEDLTKVSSDTISLQMAAIDVIVNRHWTAACDLVTRFFSLSQQEYNAGLLTDIQFISVIKAVESLASLDAGETLASYLNVLNRETEEGKNPSSAVVLALINSLGSLGDKAAFDYLFNVQHLNYPEDVIVAARDALARLKL